MSIDFKTIPANVPSICIPRVFKNITRERVMGVIRDLDLGLIDRVDMVQRENEKGDKFQRVFIHFKKWHSNPNAIKAREMLVSGKEIKIIYDEPWFWKISANKSISGGASVLAGEPQQKKPMIRFDESPRRDPRRDHKKSYVKNFEEPAPTFIPRSPSSSPPLTRSPVQNPSPSPTNLLDAAVSINNGDLHLFVSPKKKRMVKKPVLALEIKEEVVDVVDGELPN